MSFTAILVLVWNYFMSIQYYLIMYLNLPYLPSLVIYYSSYIFFPFLGLLADVYIRRYRAILIGVILSFVSWIIIGLIFILHSYYGFLGTLWIVPGLILHHIGFISFTANIIQYNIDQLIGASAKELSTMIYLNIAATPLAWFLTLWLPLLDDTIAELVIFITSGVALSLILVSHSLFKHKLENISLIKNPIKLIVRVLCYARKHKYPENRSALTYWEEEAPSRLDLGKEKYGGPFTEEEVEDVKTVFRILPLFIGILGFTATISDMCTNESSISCIMLEHLGVYYCTFLLLFLVYLFVHGCFYKYMPSMLTRLCIGLFFALFTCITQVFSQKFPYNEVIILQLVLMGIWYFLIFSTALEFTIAQSPEHMRGMMVGMCYASLGIGHVFDAMLFYFLLKWYYLVSCVIALIVLIVFLILAKRYKYRVRENEVNIVQIVDEHYQKYMEQEEEHIREEQIYNEEINIVD